MKDLTPLSVTESQNLENLRMIEENGGLQLDKGTSDGFTKYDTDGASMGFGKTSKVPKLKGMPQNPQSQVNVEELLDESMLLSGLDQKNEPKLNILKEKTHEQIEKDL